MTLNTKIKQISFQIACTRDRSINEELLLLGFDLATEVVSLLRVPERIRVCRTMSVQGAGVRGLGKMKSERVSPSLTTSFCPSTHPVKEKIKKK